MLEDPFLNLKVLFCMRILWKLGTALFRFYLGWNLVVSRLKGVTYFLCDLHPSHLKKKCCKNPKLTFYQAKSVFMAIKGNTEYEPQQGGLLEARFPFVHASGSALCTDKFKFPHPGCSVGFAHHLCGFTQGRDKCIKNRKMWLSSSQPWHVKLRE